jgi:predicted nucleic acid-binding Zn ribbon protein
VLYPVSVHFKGSGFYTTDYGRGSGKKGASKDGAGDSSSGEKKADSGEKKPTPAAD